VIFAADIGLQDFGWAVVAPRTGRVAELGTLHQKRIKALDKTTCRATRIRRQGDLIRDAVKRHRCTAIAAEEMSFAGNKFNMVLSVGLSFGALAAVAAVLGLPLLVFPPKVWQHAVLGRAKDDRSAVDYDEVFRRLSSFIGARGTAADQLAALKPALRNHALDGVGIGEMAALRPEMATRIG
jgi:Holliday junction resolvasome RuvABC endonuclease subunit